MKALVTGGGGFLGRHIAARLQECGAEVTVLARRRYPELQAAGMHTVQADICDLQAVRTACRHMDAVFHVAALTDIWAGRKRMWSVNVEGTRHVLRACRTQGVSRLIYTSTPSVVFGEGDLCGVDERQPYPERFLSWYPRSKASAERLVLEAHSAELATVALRPHLIWGPGDPHLIPRVIQRARAGKLIQVGDGSNRVDITYIANAAQAHLQACDALISNPDCGGRAYFISQGEPVVLWSWLKDLLRRLDLPPISRTVSYRSARRVGAVLETCHRLLGVPREPRMTRFTASQLACHHYFDITAARRDLGYDPAVSTAEGLDRLVESLRA